MGFYKFADRVFEIKNKYKYLESFCVDYACEEQEPFDVIAVDDEEIMAEQTDSAENAPPPYLETLAVYRKISERLAKDDCFLMHAAVIEYRGRAYAFSAKSGTGKSTHIALWEKAFGNEVRVINGDKPLVRKRENNGTTQFIVYGTPWCGKERKQTNDSAVLSGLCRLVRSEENYIKRAGEEAVPFLLSQMLYKKDACYLGALMDFADALVQNVPVYELGVNTDISAAFVARDYMCGI